MSLGPFDWLARRAEIAPGRVFAAVLAVHGVIWFLLPVLFHDNLMRDQIEGFAWGQEWQWGYAKHPPLWAWILEGSARIIGHPSALAAYAIGVASGLLGMAIVWATILEFSTPIGAMIGALTLDGILYFNFRTVDFNANVVLLPLWAGAGYFALQVQRCGRLRDWLGLSVCLALGFYGKYETGILGAVLAGYFLIDPVARRQLASWKPWFAAAIGAALLAPHLVWLVDHDFEPVDYAVARTGEAATWLGHLTSPAVFLGAQIPECLGFALLLIPLLRTDGKAPRLRKCGPPEGRLIWTLAIAPLALTAALAMISGRPFIARWAYPMFLYFGPAAVMRMRAPSRDQLARFFAMFALVSALIILSFALYFWAMPKVLHRSTKPQFPGLALAQTIDARWNKAEPGRPLAYVVGDIWTAGNVSFYLDEVSPGTRPHVVIDGDLRTSPWINPADLAAKGGILVWLDEGQPPPDFLKQFPDAQIQESAVLPIDPAGRLKPVTVGIALLAARQ